MGDKEVIRIDDPWSDGYAAGYKDAKGDADKEINLLLTALTLITRYVNGTGREVLKRIRGS